jgi:hypothetical protein
VERYYILGDSSDGECKMLKMGIDILRSLPIEWALLHHIDECRLKLKVTISDIRLRASTNVVTGRGQKVNDALLSGHRH